MNSIAPINLKIHIKSKNNTNTTKIHIKSKIHYRNCIGQSNLIGIELSSA